MSSPIDPIDAHDVAEAVVLEVFDLGMRIHQCDQVEEFLEAFAELEPYAEAVRWLTGHAAGELSQAAVDVIRKTRAFWQTVLEDHIADGDHPEDVDSARRRQAEFDRVLEGVGWA